MYDSFDFFRTNSEPIYDVIFSSSFPIPIITLIVRLNADSIDLHNKVVWNAKPKRSLDALRNCTTERKTHRFALVRLGDR